MLRADGSIRPLDLMDVEFVGVAESVASCPHLGLPEVALAGRSNVGKSSLINALVGRKALVRTSKDPGRTRMLGFIRVARRVVLVDLPGYGYAKVARSERARWAPMVEGYLADRRELSLVLLLIDCRRDPDASEAEFVSWLTERRRPIGIVATKIDKLPRGQRSVRLRAIARALGQRPEDVLSFSSVTGEGKKELWARIDTTRVPSPDASVT